ncbi:MAG: heavy metal translocating P-type ATPase [Candidatus Obscuribacterales bacterium]
MRKWFEPLFLLLCVIALAGGIVFRKELHALPGAWTEWIFFVGLYLVIGWRILYIAARRLLHGRALDEYFLMSVATVGAMLIHDLPEAVAVLLFFRIGEYFQNLSLHRSRSAIKALIALRPDYANVESGGEIRQVDPESVEVGALIVIRPGERVPLDGEVVDGDSQVDTSALTGESLPRQAKPGGEVLAGMVNKGGLLKVRVSRPFEASSMAKALRLVEQASARKARTERFMTRIAKVYTPIVVGLAIIVAVAPPLLIPGQEWSTSIYRALVLLVVSCPCGLVISIPLGYFAGIGAAARLGVLIKGSTYLDRLARLTTIVFDKTGTLTTATFAVTEVNPEPPWEKQELLKVAAKAVAYSTHPVAQSIVTAAGEEIDGSDAAEYEEIPGHGVRARIAGRTIFVGNDRLLHQKGIDHPVCVTEGTVAHVAVNGVYAGHIVSSDEIRENTAEVIADLRDLGVNRVYMFSGDSESVARGVSEELQLDGYDAQLLPEEKVAHLEAVMAREPGVVAFVGDGINDAPVITRADIGLAMGGLGSDAAIETADVVIMSDRLERIGDSIRVARKSRRIVWQNIILAFAVKTVVVVLGTLGLAMMWAAIIADVGVALLAVLNATRALRPYVARVVG